MIGWHLGGNVPMLKKLLFENVGVKQTVFKNTFWLVMATGANKLLNSILIIYVARVLGATNYGKFTFALAFVSLLVIFSDFDLPSIITRELSKEIEREKEFPAIFSLKILLSLGTLILMLVGSFFITHDSKIQRIIWILAIYILISNFSGIIYAFLKARQRMEYVFLATILRALVVTGAGFLVILNFPSVENLSYGYLFASLAALIFILVFFHLKIFPLKFSWQKPIWLRYLAMSWPLALSTIFVRIYRSIDSIMMGYFGLITEVGWYNAAYKIIGLTVISSSLISESFYPILSKAFKESEETFQKLWNYHMETKISLAIPLVVGGVIFAPRIIYFIYNPSFAPSVFAFQILAVGAGIIFLNSVFAQALIVSNQQKKFLLITLFGAIINIILNLILIPKFSLYGAAFAALITFLLNFFFYLRFTFKFTSIRPLNARLFLGFIGAGFCSIPMYFVISQPRIYQLDLFLSILMGATTYAVFLLLYRRIVKHIFHLLIFSPT